MTNAPKPTPWAGGRSVPLGELFRAFLAIGLMGFGGVGPITRHQLVDRRRWLSDEEFTALLGLCKVLPGANTINVAVITADRFQGLKGVFAALAALLAAPIVMAVALLELYAHWAGEPLARAAMAGAGAGAAGLVIGTAVKMALTLRRDPISIVSVVATLVSTIIFSAPLLAVVGVVGSCAAGATVLRDRRTRSR